MPILSLKVFKKRWSEEKNHIVFKYKSPKKFYQVNVSVEVILGAANILGTRKERETGFILRF